MNDRSHALPIAALLFLQLLSPGSLQANPVISEFLAENETGILDGDGATSDWIEIHNPTGATINLENWALTDNASNLARWKFPAVSLGAGQYMLVWASGKNRRVAGQELHTNFSLNNGGEYLALVQPNGTVYQQYNPEYPSQDPDRSYGLTFSGTPLMVQGAACKYLVPANGELGTSWKEENFADGAWSPGNTGLGFGALSPGMTIRVVAKNQAQGTLTNLADTDQLMRAAPGSSIIAAESTQILPVFNILGNGSDGHYAFNTPAPAFAVDHYSALATGYINFPATGIYTLGLNSDDGGRILIDLNGDGNFYTNAPTNTIYDAGENFMVDDSNHGPEDHMASGSVSAGVRKFEAVFWEQGGGDEVEFFGAAGSHGAWSAPIFDLVGDTANGGLAAFTTPTIGAVNDVILTNTETVQRNANATLYTRIPFTVDSASAFDGLTLRMRYMDGFTAYLNGTLVASRNSPGSPLWNSSATATRSVLDAFTAENIVINQHVGLLHNGINTLAIHAMNNSSADGSFLTLPELQAASPVLSNPSAFYNTPTPGMANGTPSSYGHVADTGFNPKRGFYPSATVTTIPFNVTISTATPQASIRFTLDGSTPTASYGTLYSGPISITKTTVIRAIAYRPGWDSTNVDTHTFVILDEVITQSSTGAPPQVLDVNGATVSWPTGPVNSQILDYGMDPDIVNHPTPAEGGAATVKNALTALPSVFITTAVDNLFGSSGIYTNPGGRGLAWERPASMELMNDPGGGFQVDCGIRIRGGFSRSTDNPKHGFHLYFRQEYGPDKLNYPLFGEEGTSEFDQIDFRTSQNYSWSFGGDSRNTFLREEFSRDSQGAMGQPYSRCRFYHLYINGQYWGLFNSEERTEAAYAESYFGGQKEDYDVIKTQQDQGYISAPTDGNAIAWNLLRTKLRAHDAEANPTSKLDKYFEMQGLLPGGTVPYNDPVNHPVLLDVDNLIDYMLLTFFTGNQDGATSAFLGDDKANNFFSLRKRDNSMGFLHFAHDFEHSLFDPNMDRTGYFSAADNTINDANYFNPMFMHYDLMENPEYRRRFGDRVQKHLFNNGALTVANCLARVNARAAQIDQAIIAESARWGDAKVATPFTRSTWVNAKNEVLNHFSARHPIVISQLQADGLYPPPSVGGVTLNRLGGYVAITDPITMSGSPVTYYTTNGTDPRLLGGGMNGTAQVFAQGSTTTETLVNWGKADPPPATTNPADRWKYREPSIDLGASDIVVGHPNYDATNWKHPLFNDTSAEWKLGFGELGAGDAGEGRPERTLIDIGPGSARYQVVYFRKSFQVTDPTVYSSFSLDALIDDAAIIYINGKEVARDNLSPGVAYGYEYSVAGSIDEANYRVIPGLLDLSSVLIPGTNVICVQVHQTNSTSSDLSFDLRLRATKTTYPIPLFLTTPGETRMMARSYDSATSTWGALTEALFLVDAEPASAANLSISEIMYHPSDPTAPEITAGYLTDDKFEYIELRNTGTKMVDLMGVHFTMGIDFNFDDSEQPRLLAPGQHILVAGNRAAFALRYGAGLPVAGAFADQLDNAGERILLVDSNHVVIQDLTYGDALEPGWPLSPDGLGKSLILMRPDAHPNANDPANWRPSISPNPGTSDALSFASFKATNSLAATTSDEDHDGLVSLLEYGLNGNPQEPSTAPWPVLTTEFFLAETFPLLQFQKRAGADDVRLTVETSTDLTNWNPGDATLVERTAGPDGTESFTYRGSLSLEIGPRYYLRVRGTLIP